jgi:CHASE3 domain sensor protein
MGKRNTFLLAAIGCVLAVIILQVLLVNQWLAMHETRDRQADIRHEILRLERLVADIDNGFRGYVLMKQAAFLGPMIAAEGRLPGVVERLERLTRDRSDLDGRLQVLQARIIELLETKRRLTRDLEQGEEKAVLAYIKGGEGLALASTITLAFQDLDRRLYEQQRKSEEDHMQRSRWMRWGLPLTAIGGVACGISLGRTASRFRTETGTQTTYLREGIG